MRTVRERFSNMVGSLSDRDISESVYMYCNYEVRVTRRGIYEERDIWTRVPGVYAGSMTQIMDILTQMAINMRRNGAPRSRPRGHDVFENRRLYSIPGHGRDALKSTTRPRMGNIMNRRVFRVYRLVGRMLHKMQEEAREM